MDTDVNLGLVTGNSSHRRAYGLSMLLLWSKRRLGLWFRRYWPATILLAVTVIYYWSQALYSSTPIRDWSPMQANPYEETSPAEWNRRASAVKEAFVQSYDWYERLAFPKDEWKPLAGKGTNMMNSWGLTAIDSLDTMILMDLQPQVNRTIHHIATLDFRRKHRSSRTPFFETTIRYLGGLLSAYHLTGNQILLDKADSLGNVLLPAFNTPSGLPYFAIDSATGTGTKLEWSGGYSLLAEVASCQLEFKYLAKVTGNRIYFEKVDKITTILEQRQGNGGLWETFWNTTTGQQANDHHGVGAWADSAYEYLLKEYLLTNQRDKRLERMYRRAAFGAITQLIYLSPRRHMPYITDIRQGLVTGRFEHLSCFFPALLMLGVWSLQDMPTHEQEIHRMAAYGLAESCWIMYKDMETGLGPESVLFDPFLPHNVHAGLWMKHYQKWVKKGRRVHGPLGLHPLPTPADPHLFGPKNRDYSIEFAEYRLRPETIECMYIMWKTTRDPIWRERAWEIFENLERSSRVWRGYATVSRVDVASSGYKDSMPSYLFAETFKYLYLIFLPLSKDPWSLSQYVFTTEAHPLPIFRWSEEEQKEWDEFRATSTI